MTAMPQVDGVRHRDVEAAGIRFHVAEAGEGDPVLLLHGWPQSWYAWRKVIPLLAGDRRVICPDLRGFGWSDAPPGLYTMDELTADMLALLDALELERVDFMAHDWGAWIGFKLCLGHPERFAHYVALNMLPPWPDPPSPRLLPAFLRLWYQVVLATPGLGTGLIKRTDFVKRLISTAAVQDNVWTPEDLEVFASVLRDPARAQASKHLYRSFLTRELPGFARHRNQGRRLEVPTLLMIGTKDPALDSKRLGAWEENADDMRVELHDESAHFIAEELPELVAGRARELFDGAG